ncbi:WGxxGxxG family protein [Paenibacillus dokdonensis]|uniref:WGxxGxxG family protein n=1 Tax=Paenibacillus dokdonensis TaxID=2567944 RepID=UPI0010A7DEB5|nr:WGxxGxxG family protein [Paenibacillus dokdonensis]
MKRQIKGGLLVAGLSLMLAVPAYAHTAAEDGGNGGMGNGMGTAKTNNGSNYKVNEVGTGPNYDVSVYGTSTGSQYLNTKNRMIDTGRMETTNYNGNRPDMLSNSTDRGLHTNSTTTNRGVGSWGWLGLLGLFGLAGMRNKNSDRERS